jgi:hypothetical protein
MREVENGITFRLFEEEHFLTSKELSSHLGFHSKCSTDLDHSLRGFNCHKFWGEISGQVVVGKFQPHNTQI